MTTSNPISDPEDAVIVDLILEKIGPMDAATHRMASLFEGHAHRVMSSTVNGINSVMGLAVNIPDHAARRIVTQGGTHLLGMDIRGQTRKALFAALAESRAQGLHPSSAATRRLIQKHVSAGRFVNAGSKYRSKLIARTETMHAQNLSSLAAYESSIAVQAVELVDDQMGHGDQECSLRNGLIMSIADARRVPEHPAGTLAFLPIVT